MCKHNGGEETPIISYDPAFRSLSRILHRAIFPYLVASLRWKTGLLTAAAVATMSSPDINDMEPQRWLDTAPAPTANNMDETATLALQDVLSAFEMGDLQSLFKDLITTSQFLDPFTAYRDAYLLHPRYAPQSLRAGGGFDMSELFGSIQREVNGRAAKLHALGDGADPRAYTVRLFALMARRMLGKGGLCEGADGADEAWLWELCGKLDVLICHVKKEYGVGSGVVRDRIESAMPSVWSRREGEPGWGGEAMNGEESRDEAVGREEEDGRELVRRRMSDSDDSSYLGATPSEKARADEEYRLRGESFMARYPLADWGYARQERP